MVMQQKECNTALFGKSKARDMKIDCMKGILIFLVVFGHSIQYGSGRSFFSEECYFEDILFKVIYSFHMPCFGIISGLLYYRYVRNRTFMKKLQKVWKLLLPMLGFAVINVAISLCKGEILVAAPDILKNYIWIVNYNWWFIWSIIICYMFWGVLDALQLKCSVKIVLAFCVQTLFVILPNRANSPLYGFIFLYFLIGYYITDLMQICEKLKEEQRRLIKYAIVILWIGCIIFYRREDYIYTSSLSINGENKLRQLGIDIFRWITGILGSFIFLEIMNKWILKGPRRILALLSFMGRNTIYIYILQGYFCMWLMKVIEIEYVPIHFLFNFLQAVSIMAICCMLIYGSKKMKQRVKMLKELPV